MPHTIDRLSIMNMRTYRHCSSGPASPIGAHPPAGEWTA